MGLQALTSDDLRIPGPRDFDRDHMPTRFEKDEEERGTGPGVVRGPGDLEKSKELSWADHPLR